jgi:hypothetical protein
MPTMSFAALRPSDRNAQQGELLDLALSQKPFTDEMHRLLRTLLACTAYDQWPYIAKLAFDEASKSHPSGAAIYKHNLPKRKE